MGCNCHNDETPLSLKQKIRREFKQKVADIIYDYTGGTVLLGSLKLEDTEMLGDLVAAY